MARTTSATETHGKGSARLVVWRFSTLLISLSLRSALRGSSIPAPRSRPARRSLSLPVRWRFLLLSRLAARAGFVTQRQTFVRRCQTLWVLVALMGWAGGCQPWGRSASSAVAATPRQQTRCLLLLVEEALGGYAHVSQ